MRHSPNFKDPVLSSMGWLNPVKSSERGLKLPQGALTGHTGQKIQRLSQMYAATSKKVFISENATSFAANRTIICRQWPKTSNFLFSEQTFVLLQATLKDLVILEPNCIVLCYDLRVSTPD